LLHYSLDSKQLVQKYGSIIIDFAYFKAASVYEQKIEDDSVNINIFFAILMKDEFLEIRK